MNNSTLGIHLWPPQPIEGIPEPPNVVPIGQKIASGAIATKAAKAATKRAAERAATQKAGALAAAVLEAAAAAARGDTYKTTEPARAAFAVMGWNGTHNVDRPEMDLSSTNPLFDSQAAAAAAAGPLVLGEWTCPSGAFLPSGTSVTSDPVVPAEVPVQLAGAAGDKLARGHEGGDKAPRPPAEQGQTAAVAEPVSRQPSAAAAMARAAADDDATGGMEVPIFRAAALPSSLRITSSIAPATAAVTAPAAAPAAGAAAGGVAAEISPRIIAPTVAGAAVHVLNPMPALLPPFSLCLQSASQAHKSSSSSSSSLMDASPLSPSSSAAAGAGASVTALNTASPGAGVQGFISGRLPLAAVGGVLTPAAAPLRGLGAGHMHPSAVPDLVAAACANPYLLQALAAAEARNARTAAVAGVAYPQLPHPTHMPLPVQAMSPTAATAMHAMFQLLMLPNGQVVQQPVPQAAAGGVTWSSARPRILSKSSVQSTRQGGRGGLAAASAAGVPWPNVTVVATAAAAMAAVTGPAMVAAPPPAPAAAAGPQLAGGVAAAAAAGGGGAGAVPLVQPPPAAACLHLGGVAAAAAGAEGAGAASPVKPPAAAGIQLRGVETAPTAATAAGAVPPVQPPPSAGSHLATGVAVAAAFSATAAGAVPPVQPQPVAARLQLAGGLAAAAAGAGAGSPAQQLPQKPLPRAQPAVAIAARRGTGRRKGKQVGSARGGSQLPAAAAAEAAGGGCGKVEKGTDGLSGASDATWHEATSEAAEKGGVAALGIGARMDGSAATGKGTGAAAMAMEPVVVAAATGTAAAAVGTEPSAVALAAVVGRATSEAAATTAAAAAGETCDDVCEAAAEPVVQVVAGSCRELQVGSSSQGARKTLLRKRATCRGAVPAEVVQHAMQAAAAKARAGFRELAKRESAAAAAAAAAAKSERLQQVNMQTEPGMRVLFSQRAAAVKAVARLAEKPGRRSRQQSPGPSLPAAAAAAVGTASGAERNSRGAASVGLLAGGHAAADGIADRTSDDLLPQEGCNLECDNADASGAPRITGAEFKGLLALLMQKRGEGKVVAVKQEKQQNQQEQALQQQRQQGQQQQQQQQEHVQQQQQQEKGEQQNQGKQAVQQQQQQQQQQRQQGRQQQQQPQQHGEQQQLQQKLQQEGATPKRALQQQQQQGEEQERHKLKQQHQQQHARPGPGGPQEQPQQQVQTLDKEQQMPQAGPATNQQGIKRGPLVGWEEPGDLKRHKAGVDHMDASEAAAAAASILHRAPDMGTTSAVEAATDCAVVATIRASFAAGVNMCSSLGGGSPGLPAGDGGAAAGDDSCGCNGINNNATGMFEGEGVADAACHEASKTAIAVCSAKSGGMRGSVALAGQLVVEKEVGLRRNEVEFQEGNERSVVTGGQGQVRRVVVVPMHEGKGVAGVGKMSELRQSLREAAQAAAATAAELNCIATLL